MGCSIAAALEVKRRGEWQMVKRPNKYFQKWSEYGSWDREPELTGAIQFDSEKDYDLFAILADVRNNNYLEPMSNHRGIPDDISPEAAATIASDHSHTWITLADALAYWWTRKVEFSGWVNGVTLAHWELSKEWKRRPDEWSLVVTDPDMIKVNCADLWALIAADIKAGNSTEREKAIGKYAQYCCELKWDIKYAELGKQFLLEVLPEMLQYGTEVGYDHVRMVMGFTG